MLKSARRSAFIGNVFSFVWWLLILVVIPYVTWLYLQPYLNTILTQYQTIQEQSGLVSAQAQNVQQQLNQLGGFQELLKQFGIGASQ